MLEIEANKRPTAAQLVAEFQGHVQRLGSISPCGPTNIRHSFPPPVAKNDDISSQPASNLRPHHASTVQSSSTQQSDRRNAGPIPADHRVSAQPTEQSKHVLSVPSVLPQRTPFTSVHSISPTRPTVPLKPCDLRSSRIASTHAPNHGQRKSKPTTTPCQTQQPSLGGVMLAGQERRMPPSPPQPLPVPGSAPEVLNPGFQLPLATTAQRISNTMLRRPSTPSRNSQVSHTWRSGNCRPNPIPASNVNNLRPLMVRNPIGQVSRPDGRNKVADVTIVMTLPELHHSFFNTPELIGGIPKKHRTDVCVCFVGKNGG